MEKPPTTISQAQLVDGPQLAKKGPQYVAALSATIGALAAGTMLGWSAPAGPKLTIDGEYGFFVGDEAMSWIGSLSTLGAAVICYPIGIIMGMIGRKLSMLLLVTPFTIGWLLIIFATNVDMLYAGRFFIGLASGGFCVTAPAYNSEIAQDEIRGTVGTFFQLMITIGILFAYVVGSYTSVFIFSIICGLIPLIFGVIFFFMPESPYYLVSCNRLDDAKKSLERLRGSDYDVQSELDKLQKKVEEDQKSESESGLSFHSIQQKFFHRAPMMAISICMALMFFQQFSGINAVLFNTTTIFKDAGSDIDESISTIIIGVIQVIATLAATFLIDRAGRKILLLISAFAMGACLIALGVYFFLKQQEDTDVSSISWLPLASLCIFIVAFSIGFGPIPWMVSGDVCTPNIKAFVSSSAGTFNWILAFTVTKTFDSMKEGLEQYGTYWLFAGIIIVGGLFVLVVIPETKGKSNEEVQAILCGNKMTRKEMKYSDN